MKKSLDEIKFHFENRNFDHRIDFIDDYDFEDEFYDYYHSFIVNHTDFKNHLYLSELIDLARWLRMFDSQLYSRYFGYLFEQRHYLVKLAVLDYLLDSIFFYSDRESERRIMQFLDQKLSRILRNQALLNLLSLESSDKNNCLRMIEKSLQNTTDWRSIYRVLNLVESVPSLMQYKKEIASVIQRHAKTRDFGSDVERKVNKIMAD